MTAKNGFERERNLSHDAYFSESYFKMPQLFSSAHQINGIHGMRPTSILEVGIGNGLVSDFFRKAGVPVATADINPNLKPDYVAPLHELPQIVGDKRFDLVVCCEVLEHMPFEMFDQNLSDLRKLGDRLFLTLPNNRRFFGIGGTLRLPKTNKTVGIHIPFKRKGTVPPEHFWEVDYKPEHSSAAIVTRLYTHYEAVRTWRFPTNTYHQAFEAW